MNDQSIWMCRLDDGRWALQHERKKGQDTAYAFSQDEDAQSPEYLNDTKWKYTDYIPRKQKKGWVFRNVGVSQF